MSAGKGTGTTQKHFALLTWGQVVEAFPLDDHPRVPVYIFVFITAMRILLEPELTPKLIQSYREMVEFLDAEAENTFGKSFMTPK